MKIVVIIFITLCGAQAELQHCCPAGQWMVAQTKLCSDNITANSLQCAEGMFLMDPQRENFTIDESTGQLSATGSVGQKDFCVAKIERKSQPVSDYDVAFVCFAGPENEFPLILIQILMGLSILFLSLTLAVYLYVPELRDLQGKCQMFLIISLAASYVALLFVYHSSNSSHTSCIVQAYMVYFWTLSAFFWMNASTFNIWRTICWNPFKLSECVWLWILMFWGFGMPTVFVIICIVAETVAGDHTKPNIGVTKCWLKGPEETWSFFYGPISILLVLNVIMFISTCCKLWREYNAIPNRHMQSQRFKCMLYLRLFLLMGITWVFEVISYGIQFYKLPRIITMLWALTDCLNSLQGVIIFLVLVVFRKKAKAGLVKHKVWFIPWPKSWAQGINIEEDTVSSKDATELNHPHVAEDQLT